MFGEAKEETQYIHGSSMNGKSVDTGGAENNVYFEAEPWGDNE